jgi:hypothetical protein
MGFLDGLSRPARAAGLGLLSLAVVAAAVGVFTLTGGDGGDGGDETAAPQPTSSATSVPSGAPGGPPAPSGAPSVPPRSPDPSGEPSAPPPGPSAAPGEQPDQPGAPSGEPGQVPDQQGEQGQDGSGPDQPAGPPRPGGEPGGNQGRVPADQPDSQHIALRVYNNSNIQHLAARAAKDLREQGWNVVHVGNYPYGVISTTTAYYRPGTSEESAARSLGTTFGMRVEPRFDGIKDSSPGVIVIVTKDYEGPQGKIN